MKSQISGIVEECFVEVGDRVEVGQPLFSITPDPTPLELAEAEREVQLAQIAYDRTTQDLERDQEPLLGRHRRARTSSTRAQKDFDQAQITLEQAKDKLALLKEGRIERQRGPASTRSSAPRPRARCSSARSTRAIRWCR